MLDINQLSIQLGTQTLSYHQQIKSGDIVTLQGISGVGKSSLLLCISGFIPTISGSIHWQGQAINQLPIEQRPVAMLFQENNLFEHISVLKNACLSISADNVSNIHKYAEQLNISDQMHKMPNQLSGGQRQRIGLLRTLLRPEPIILLDEPFAELDNKTREICADWLASIAKSTHKTVLLVTHQLEDVDKLADHNWVIG
ncbi:MAG: ATP-binding cassette domain-containing protein [Oceanospirillaceae bacterium]